jgi:hypothetical protein
MKHEYHEGHKAGENFKKLATATFQKPMIVAPGKKQPKSKPLARTGLRTVPFAPPLPLCV